MTQVQLFLLMTFIHIRWVWFHISPRYVRFTISEKESYFQDMKNNEIMYNYSIKEAKDEL